MALPGGRTSPLGSGDPLPHAAPPMAASDADSLRLPIMDPDLAERYSLQRLAQHFGLGEPAAHDGAAGWAELLRMVYTDRRTRLNWGPDPVAMHPANVHDRTQANKADYIRRICWSGAGSANSTEWRHLDVGYGSTNAQLDAIVKLLIKLEREGCYDAHDENIEVTLKVDGHPRGFVVLEPGLSLVVNHSGCAMYLICERGKMRAAWERERAREQAGAAGGEGNGGCKEEDDRQPCHEEREIAPITKGHVDADNDDFSEKIARYERLDNDGDAHDGTDAGEGLAARESNGGADGDSNNPFVRVSNKFSATVPIRFQDFKFSKKDPRKLKNSDRPSNVVWKPEVLEVRRCAGGGRDAVDNGTKNNASSKQAGLQVIRYHERISSLAEVFAGDPGGEVDAHGAIADEESLLLLRTSVCTAVEELLPFCQVHCRLQDMGLGSKTGTMVCIESAIEESVYAQFRSTRERLSKLGFCPKDSPDAFVDVPNGGTPETPFVLDAKTEEAVAKLGPVFHSKVRLFGEADRCDQIFHKLVVFDMRQPDGGRYDRAFVDSMLEDPVFEKENISESAAIKLSESFLARFANRGAGRLVVHVPLIAKLSLAELMRLTPTTGLFSMKVSKKELKNAANDGNKNKYKRQREGVVWRRCFEPKHSHVPGFFEELEDRLRQVVTFHGEAAAESCGVDIGEFPARTLDGFLAEGFVFRFTGLDLWTFRRDAYSAGRAEERMRSEEEQCSRFGEFLFKFKNYKYDSIG